MYAGPVSTMAGEFERLFWFLIVLCGFTAVLIIGLLIFFSVKYRRRPGHTQPQPVKRKRVLVETIWIGVPLITFLVIFAWASKLYLMQMEPPSTGLQIYVVGQQWMWKMQHPEGPREINELHVPVDRPVSITLTSQDVIHSFFVPDFHIKMDAVPGRYTQIWFKAKKPGKYRIFCSQYCGTWHARMTGQVIAMRPGAYTGWLLHERVENMALQGRRIFQRHDCMQCHIDHGPIAAPSLKELFGSKVRLTNGQAVTADENYLHDSIFYPGRQIVAGYANIMPTYIHQLSEEDVNELIEYIKSLSSGYKG